MEIELGTAASVKQLFNGEHELPPKASATKFRIDGEVIDPAAKAVVTSEDGADNLTIENTDQEQLALNGELAPNHGLGLVTGRVAWKRPLPQLDHLMFIGFRVRAYLKLVIRHPDGFENQRRLTDRPFSCAPPLLVEQAD
jgi:hypothetical protein